MRIEKAVFTRKYNLGNYESLDLSVEASLGEKDSPQETWTVLQDQADVWFANRNKPKLQVPEPQKQEPPKEEKDYFKTEGLTWTEMPATEKGVWEKCEQLEKLGEIVKALESAGKPLFSKEPAALYWLLQDREMGKVTGVGRRRK